MNFFSININLNYTAYAYLLSALLCSTCCEQNYGTFFMAVLLLLHTVSGKKETINVLCNIFYKT